MRTPIFSSDGSIAEAELAPVIAPSAEAPAIPVQFMPVAAQSGPIIVLGESRQQAIDAKFRAALAASKPQLLAATDALERCKRTFAEWAETVRQHEYAVSRLRNLVSLASLSVEHEDAEGTGSRSSRLRAAQAELEEARLELAAAVEELQMAEQRVYAVQEKSK